MTVLESAVISATRAAPGESVPYEARPQAFQQLSTFPARQRGAYPGGSSRLRLCCLHKAHHRQSAALRETPQLVVSASVIWLSVSARCAPGSSRIGVGHLVVSGSVIWLSAGRADR